MSRGPGERRTAWQVWVHFYTRQHGVKPTAYDHHCGSIGNLTTDGDYQDFADIMCPGCRFEIAHPEQECTPLFRLGDGHE